MLSWKKLMLQATGKSARTTLWLLRIILPISLLVRLLDYFGTLAWLAGFLDPLFVNMGLPGSTAIVFITSIFLPLYAPLAIITSLPITLRELTILALMCQISHNLPVESAIQAKTGTSFWSMTLLRITMSIVVGVLLNLILPAEMGLPLFARGSVTAVTSIGALLILWLKGSLQIALLILVIVFLLNLFYSMLEAYRLIPGLSRAIEPLLAFFGLPRSTAFLWLIGYIVGLAYGGALMIDQMKEGRVTRSEASLLNHHLAVSHSVLEDNLLFVALGVSLWWILAVRFTIAFAVVWLRRFWLNLRSPRVTF
ncbi:MAG: nucleoside recognition domain-containing protein [Proteiniphilum sp.]|nr:nucleoside recognition domain-containing protein [Proteiniphilum sp.]MDD2726255.1 nucleoside recognition domain-containing protein [Proteiniphilum sp.]MDD3332337.1 nucleoside recognition domain-containing protein [Proteiniphilum sp.]MDD3555649.1 nucleoside recognition domain-containing protein [Proteiniphilum sp.]MDD3979203.1 nucleoside recognition domain-containing protein [Proteiniphilum sp.]